MVAGATHQQQQQASQSAPPSSSTAPAATTEEEEFLKRNTDCVYFLASPLTCKKGSECEYRHSDIARVNPRDCWYWLNGNCLNPKCGFRHPPLDGLLGAEVPTTVGPSVPQAPVAPAPYATSYAMPKQGVACIFFQKGFCLKGQLCPFLHGPPNTINNKAAQAVPPNPVTKPPQMASAGPEKSVQEQKLTQPENVQKPVEFLPPQGKQVPSVQAPAPARNGGGGGVAMEKKVQTLSGEPPKYRPVSVVPPPVKNEFPAGRSNHGVYETRRVSDNDSILNGKDADEYSREPTPGFDVLVDNEVGDSEYYLNEEQFGRPSGHDFDIGRSTDYDVDQDMYSEQHDYDHYDERNRLHGERYAWEDHRASSERMLAGAANLERKRYPRDDSHDQFDESDLRHRISKHRRGNVGGLRSVVSHEHARDSHADRMPRRDGHHYRPDLGSLSSRLRGRIKIPGRSTSPGNENDLRVERETDMGRQHRSRYSPGRPPHTSSNHSRLRDRIKGRVSEDYNNEGRDYRGSRGHRDMGSDNDSEFTGPKRLSELKSGRAGEGYEQQTDDRRSLGKRKYPRLESQQSEDNLSFEGPKPLSEILKRKRGAETTAVDTRISSVNIEDNNLKEIKENNQKERKEILSGSIVNAYKEESDLVSPGFVGAEKQTGSINAENDKSMGVRSSLNHDVSEPENEVGPIDEDAMLDQELEAYDHRDGDYDFEQIDGEDYNLDEGENPDEEYIEEEDGNECAKKESGVCS